MKSKTVQREKAPRARNARGEGQRLRDEIIAAAIKVLSTIGAEDPFSLRAVAKEAKIAAPSVYIHFADRNVLLLAVLEKLFREQVAIRAAAEDVAAGGGGGPWERLLARSIAAVEFGLKHPGHYKVLFEGRVVLRLNDPRIADFGRPLLVRSIELIREIKPIRCQGTGLTRSATAGASPVVGLARSDLASHQQAHIGLAVCHRACRTDHTRHHPAQIAAPLTRRTPSSDPPSHAGSPAMSAAGCFFGLRPRGLPISSILAAGSPQRYYWCISRFAFSPSWRAPDLVHICN